MLGNRKFPAVITKTAYNVRDGTTDPSDSPNTIWFDKDTHKLMIDDDTVGVDMGSSADTEVLFNSGGEIAGSNELTYDMPNGTLDVLNITSSSISADTDEPLSLGFDSGKSIEVWNGANLAHELGADFYQLLINDTGDALKFIIDKLGSLVNFKRLINEYETFHESVYNGSPFQTSAQSARFLWTTHLQNPMSTSIGGNPQRDFNFTGNKADTSTLAVINNGTGGSALDLLRTGSSYYAGWRARVSDSQISNAQSYKLNLMHPTGGEKAAIFSLDYLDDNFNPENGTLGLFGDLNSSIPANYKTRTNAGLWIMNRSSSAPGGVYFKDTSDSYDALLISRNLAFNKALGSIRNMTAGGGAGIYVNGTSGGTDSGTIELRQTGASTAADSNPNTTFSIEPNAFVHLGGHISGVNDDYNSSSIHVKNDSSNVLGLITHSNHTVNALGRNIRNTATGIESISGYGQTIQMNSDGTIRFNIAQTSGAGYALSSALKLYPSGAAKFPNIAPTTSTNTGSKHLAVFAEDYSNHLMSATSLSTTSSTGDKNPIYINGDGVPFEFTSALKYKRIVNDNPAVDSSFIDGIKLKRFDYKNTDPIENILGIIADELQVLNPDCVSRKHYTSTQDPEGDDFTDLDETGAEIPHGPVQDKTFDEQTGLYSWFEVQGVSQINLLYYLIHYAQETRRDFETLQSNFETLQSDFAALAESMN